MFIAKISKGRTIKQFINGTLTAPVLYSIFWMVIFGGAGIRHEREASNMGLCCPQNDKENFFLSINKFNNTNNETVLGVSDIIMERNIGGTFISSLSS